jgi:putative lipoic acid-binding regulatory protein
MDREKPGIEYPCRWTYKVIGRDPEAVRAVIQACLPLCLPGSLAQRDPHLEAGRGSAGGAYVTLSLTVMVQDEGERNCVFSTLAENPEIIMVI